MKNYLLCGLIITALSNTILSGCESLASIQLNVVPTQGALITYENTIPYPMHQIAETDVPKIASALIPEQLNLTMKYATITEVEDWGPAINKVVLDIGSTLDTASLQSTNFSVQSERQYIGYNRTLGKQEQVDTTASREITKVYVSDALGNPCEDGTYATLEMKIGPTLTEGSPFTENIHNGFHIFVDTTYHISIADGQSLYNTQGTQLTFTTTNRNNCLGNIMPVADSFDCSGVYHDVASGRTLTYATYMPDCNASIASTPLIIWLHGAGEGGTDPLVAITGNKVTNLATPAIQNLFGETGAEILVPQTSTIWLDDGTGAYMDLHGTESTSLYTKPLMSLIQSYVSNHPEIDPNRIYIGGCSNGGYMTVNMLVNYPDYFAAAFPVCEAYSACWLTNQRLHLLKDIPIWLTAAKTDSTVRLFEGSLASDRITYNFTLDQNGNPIPIDNNSNALYKRLTALGASNIHYTLLDRVLDTTGLYKKQDGSPYEYKGHLSWIYALNNQCIENIDGEDTTLFGWLAKQHRN